MVEDDLGVLRVQSQSGISAADLSEFFSALDECYRGLLRFEAVIESIAKRRFDYIYRYRGEDFFEGAFPATLMLSTSRYWSYTDLTLHAAQFNSPGFWEFLGQINPLQQIRLYLQERHERKKDNEYRKRQEEEAADWTLEEQKTKVLREKVQLAKEMGISDEEIRELFRSQVEHGMQRLLSIQDKGVIDTASVQPRSIPKQ